MASRSRSRTTTSAELLDTEQIWAGGDWASPVRARTRSLEHGLRAQCGRDRNRCDPTVRMCSSSTSIPSTAAPPDHARAELGPEDLDRIVDRRWDPPVTMGVRLVSIADDSLQHVGQAAYVRGLLRLLSRLLTRHRGRGRGPGPAHVLRVAVDRLVAEGAVDGLAHRRGLQRDTTTRRARRPGWWPPMVTSAPSPLARAAGTVPTHCRLATPSLSKAMAVAMAAPSRRATTTWAERVVHDRRRLVEELGQHLGRHPVGGVGLGVHGDEVRHAGLVLDPLHLDAVDAVVIGERAPRRASAARAPRTARGPPPCSASRRSSSSPVSRTLTEKPAGETVRRRTRPGRSGRTPRHAVARCGTRRSPPRGATSRPRTARTRRASSSAPLVLQRVMARLKAMRLAWPSAASLDGWRHRRHDAAPRARAQLAERRPGDGAPRPPSRCRWRSGSTPSKKSADSGLPAAQIDLQDGRTLPDHRDFGGGADLPLPTEDQDQVAVGRTARCAPTRSHPGAPPDSPSRRIVSRLTGV